jgi:phosphatidylglycerol lysyltransferase
LVESGLQAIPRSLVRAIKRVAYRLPVIVLAAAAAVALVGGTGIGSGFASWLGEILPVDPQTVDPVDAVTVGATLAVLAIGLFRRKRLARRLAVATFGAAALGQAVTLHHPFGAALGVVCVIALTRSRRRYRIDSDRALRRVSVVMALAGATVLVAGSLVSDAIAAAPVGSPLDDLASSLMAGLDGVDPTGILVPERAAGIFEALELAARLAVLVAAFGILRADPDRPPPDLLERYRELARRNARGALAPFQLGRDKLLFALPSGDGVVAYGRSGRDAIVLGDPIGTPPGAWRTFRAFVGRCTRGDVAVGVYQASAASTTPLEAMGFRTFKIGEEALVELRGFDLSGSRRANLRHTVARARRGGIHVVWRPNGLTPDETIPLLPALADIDAVWRRVHGPRMGFTISAFEAADLRCVGLALACEADGRPAAFATFRRTEPDAWVLDLLRRRSDATPGAIEAAVAHAALAMAEAGDRQLSLGLVALRGLTLDAGPLESRLLAVAARLVRPVYDIAGLTFFKNKFAPRWESRHAAVRGRLGAPGYVLALLRLHLAPSLPHLEPHLPAIRPFGHLRP